MTVCLLSILLITCTLVEYSEPYPPSGYRPSGPIFELPKRRLENGDDRIGRPQTNYGAVPLLKAQRDFNNNNNEYSYRTINLPPNQYGLPPAPSTTTTTQLLHTSYNSPSLTAQQLPNNQRNQFGGDHDNNVQRRPQYGVPNASGNVDVVQSVDISKEVNYNLNKPQPDGANNRNRFDTSDTNDQSGDSGSGDGGFNQMQPPQEFYNTPDGGNNDADREITTVPSDVDIRAGAPEDEGRRDVFNRIPSGNDFNNGDAGSGFGDADLGRDGYYDDKPAIQPEQETTTTTPSVNNDDYDEGFDASQNGDGNVAIANSFAGGQYYVLQADGRLQRVTFKTMPNAKDDGNGFTANLVYETVEPMHEPVYAYDNNFYLPGYSK